MTTLFSLILFTNSGKQDKSELKEVELLNNNPLVVHLIKCDGSTSVRVYN